MEYNHRGVFGGCPDATGRRPRDTRKGGWRVQQMELKARDVPSKGQSAASSRRRAGVPTGVRRLVDEAA